MISVVILTKDGERYLEKLIKTIFGQELDESFEIICIDSGSKDRTVEICKKFSVEVFSIKDFNFNHGLTRNFGIGVAKGRYIILLSQDALPFDKNWMKNLIRNLNEDEKVAGVYCRQIPFKETDLLTKNYINNFITSGARRSISFIENRDYYNKLSPKEKYKFCYFDNACSCIRRSVWADFKFKETDFGEDIEWSKRVLEAGYKIVYEPEAIVYHSHSLTICYAYRRFFINSAKLYNLFGLKIFDNIFQAALVFFWQVYCNSLYILKSKANIILKLSALIRMPFITLSITAGQLKSSFISKKV